MREEVLNGSNFRIMSPNEAAYTRDSLVDAFHMPALASNMNNM
jgi:hypothetical protein